MISQSCASDSQCCLGLRIWVNFTFITVWHYPCSSLLVRLLKSREFDQISDVTIIFLKLHRTSLDWVSAIYSDMSGTTEGQIVHVEHYRFNRFHDSVLQHNVQIYVQLALFKWNACTAVTAALNVKAVSSFPPVCTIAEIFLKNRFNLDDF